MSALPSPEDILERIEEAMVMHRGEQEPRAYLGASAVGNRCEAYLAFSLRGYPDTDPETPRIFRIFELGHLIENVVVKHLLMAKVPILPENPMTGKQWTYTAFGGHVVGHADGLYDGNTPGIVEIKSMNSDKFNKFSRLGIKYSHRSYYDQVTLLMGLSGYSYTLFVAYNKDTSAYHFEWVYLDPFDLSSLVHRIEKAMSKSPERISNDETDWRCRECFKREACWEGKLPNKRDRKTCGAAYPTKVGGWECSLGCPGGECHTWRPFVPTERTY